jgi:16S rRNA (guanine527-N7)-methyltransferase
VTPAVSRETPSEPPSIDEVFGSAAPAARRFADLLASVGVERGLVGPREIQRLWGRHLLNCAVVEPLLPTGASVADIGSGAGLPGLVWAVTRSDLDVTLVEPMLRRVRFLEEAVRHLGLTNVSIVRSRAEELHGDRDFDVVAARAVAPMSRLATWCLPLVRPGGMMAALKGASAAAELAAASSTISRLGGSPGMVATYGRDVLDTPTRVVIVRKAPRHRPSRREENP